MSDKDERHAKLNDLAARIKDTKTTCENAYHEWCRAAEHLKNLERESREIFLSLFDDIAPPEKRHG
ncbi:hypothetical protein [Bradyrhizobium tunisiense]|uniref:hypothetical protein n=1 Tax=Bradyrhizobium tunisiense TaxID=3278709 RepID=UPI0035D64239